MITGKKRNRGAVYPYEIILRLTAEMGERIEAEIDKDPTKTRVGIVRAALDKYLPKKKKER